MNILCRSIISMFSSLLSNYVLLLLCTLVGTFPEDIVLDRLSSLWKKFLLNQFHDVIPGSCIEQVVVDAMEIYEGKSDSLDVSNVCTCVSVVVLFYPASHL